jgi:hypothetical protein
MGDDQPVWKKQDLVQYPIHCLAMPDGLRYTIQSVVCHIGRASNRGHNYTIIRETQDEDISWFRYNYAGSWEIPNMPLHEEIVTSESYLIFVERGFDDTDMLDLAVVAAKLSGKVTA